MPKINTQENQFIEELKQIVHSARKMAYSAVNFSQVQQNWLIGQRIVMQEQKGKVRAEYGKHIIELASKSLTAEFGKGFSLTNIKNFKAFYLTFNDFQIGQTVSDQFENQKGQTMTDFSDTLLPMPNEKMPTASAEFTQQIWRTMFAKSLKLYLSTKKIRTEIERQKEIFILQLASKGRSAFQIFTVDVLRTKQYIHRIRSIDIISLWEIPAIARRAFISIENEMPPYAIARRAFISIENGSSQYAIARRAFISIENEMPPYVIARRVFISIENGSTQFAIARRAFISIENEQFLTILPHF